MRAMMFDVELEMASSPLAAPAARPDWAEWSSSRPYTIGIEEEVMFLDPENWGLAQRGEELLAALSPGLATHAHAETHQATVELASRPHALAQQAAAESAELRSALAGEVAPHGVRLGSAGTHPSALWSDTQVSRGARYQVVYESMRELARREPTFALHVHIGVADPDGAIVLQNRLRAHIPLLLAVSANSPFWQGRDTGLASARTPIFQAFPRVGIPRAFTSYDDWAETVDQLLRLDAFPAPTFIWWDVRPQPRLGTVEIRVMDAQTTPADTAALVGLVQTIARLELEQGFHSPKLIHADEILKENRFLAARDGMRARFLDPVAERRVPADQALADLLEACREHAQDLGTEAALDHVVALSREPGADRQRRLAEQRGLDGMTRVLSRLFTATGR
jgi:carboxylate-amine ligase